MGNCFTHYQSPITQVNGRLFVPHLEARGLKSRLSALFSDYATLVKTYLVAFLNKNGCSDNETILWTGVIAAIYPL